jgi:hypothetical protein
MIQAFYFLAYQRIGINQMDNRIYGRKENIDKKWNKNEKYILVVFRSHWKIRTLFIKESEKNKGISKY